MNMIINQGSSNVLFHHINNIRYLYNIKSNNSHHILMIFFFIMTQLSKRQKKTLLINFADKKFVLTVIILF